MPFLSSHARKQAYHPGTAGRVMARDDTEPSLPVGEERFRDKTIVVVLPDQTRTLGAHANVV